MVCGSLHHCVHAADSVCVEPAMDPECSGNTFSRVFGTSTSAFELLVLKRKIMGPCWLQIKNPHTENKGVGPAELCLRDRPEYFSSIDFVVQIRGDRTGPQRHKPVPRDGSRCTEGHAAADGYESQCQNRCESQGKQEGGSVRNGPHLDK